MRYDVQVPSGWSWRTVDTFDTFPAAVDRAIELLRGDGWSYAHGKHGTREIRVARGRDANTVFKAELTKV